MPFTLTQRLLCAARHAYMIDGAGSVAATPATGSLPGSDCIVYATAPVAAVAGDYRQDAGFVAAVPEGVVVSFRGTTPPDDPDPQQALIDWAANLYAELKAPLETPPGFPGKIHEGFHRGFMRLWAKLQPEIKATVAANPAPFPQTLYVTGHSKGGAFAVLAAWRLRKDYPNHQIVVRTFAAPRVGDKVFAAAYDAAIPDHVRYEYDDDIVPHLPVSTGLFGALYLHPVTALLLSLVDPGYGDVGRLAYIQAGGSIIADHPGLAAQRMAALQARIATQGGARHVLACHSLGAAADGYVAALYPAI